MANESSSDFGDDGDKTLFATESNGINSADALDEFCDSDANKAWTLNYGNSDNAESNASIASNASHGDLIQEPEAEKFDWNQPVYFTESDVSKLQSAFASIAQCFESLSEEHQETISKTTIPKHMSISNIPMGKAFMHFLSCFAAASGTEYDKDESGIDLIPSKTKTQAIQAWKELTPKEKKFYKKSAEVGYSMTRPHLRGISGRDFFIREKMSENIFDRIEITTLWENLSKSQKQAYYNKATQYRVKSNSPGIQREWIPLDLKNTNGKVSGFGVFKNECVNNPSMGVQTKNVKMVWLALTRDEKRVYNHRAEYLRKRAQE